MKKIGWTICILMLLMAYLKQVIPRGKTTYLMKAIVSVFILLSIFQGVSDFDFKNWSLTLGEGYIRNDKIWSDAAELVEEGLIKEFEAFLKSQKVEAKVERVDVSGDHNGFEIEKVIVFGVKAETAQKLLAGRYRIGLDSIEVKNE